MLSDEQLSLIRETAILLSEENIAVTNAFYARLFEIAPAVRPLFPQEMHNQSEKLWETLVAVLRCADDLMALEPVLFRLGRDHVSYGAMAEHYPVVANVLLETIANVASQCWTDAHDAAWKELLSFVTDHMMKGALHDAA